MRIGRQTEQSPSQLERVKHGIFPISATFKKFMWHCRKGQQQLFLHHCNQGGTKKCRQEIPDANPGNVDHIDSDRDDEESPRACDGTQNSGLLEKVQLG